MLLKNKYGGRKLDDYQPIILLNKELKILTDHLQSVVEILLGLEQTFSVKGQTIQSNLTCMIVGSIEDYKEAILRSIIMSWQLSCSLQNSITTPVSRLACYLRWIESNS